MLNEIEWIKEEEHENKIELKSLIGIMQFHMQVEDYLKGNNLFQQGDKCDSILFVINGKV